METFREKRQFGSGACSEAVLTFHASRFESDHGSLGGRSVLVDIVMPLPETSAVKHSRESFHYRDCEGFAMRATQKASREECSLQSFWS